MKCILIILNFSKEIYFNACATYHEFRININKLDNFQKWSNFRADIEFHVENISRFFTNKKSYRV